MRVVSVGQNSIANRGCEAILRTTAAMLRERLGAVEFLAPSLRADMDRQRWPEASELGVRFVPECSPRAYRAWKRLQKPVRSLKNIQSCPFPIPQWMKERLGGADIVLSMGGDLYTLDYGFPALLIKVTDTALDMGKRIVLWGASVGPFEAAPGLISKVTDHLSRMSFIGARDSLSRDYLVSTLSVTCPVYLVADPAFTLLEEEVDIESFWPRPASRGVLGLNLNPYIQPKGGAKGPGLSLIDEAASFAERFIESTDMCILLIPHATPWHGRPNDNDLFPLEGLRKRLSRYKDRVTMMPATLNAPQTKYVISRCRFYVGARTHSAIAALSSGVPCLTLAYSAKAAGINLDIFGHTDWMIEKQDISADSLLLSLRSLIDAEAHVKTVLKERIPVIQERALSQAELLEGLLV